MEFRRISGLPPYVFAEVNDLKTSLRRASRDIIDLGFGNPDIPSPEAAVSKLCEAAQNPKNHRYSASKGIPKLRAAIADLYERNYGVTIDPESEVVTTIGSKDGLCHLMWVLVGSGDTALVPSPSYPIHIYAPLFAGADVRHVRLDLDAASEAQATQNFFESLKEAWETAWPKPRVIVLSFPHNPTTSCVDLDWMVKIVEFAHEHDVKLLHDFAYSDLGFDGYKPPSILEVEGAKEVAVELYSMTKGFSMAGWRVAFCVGNKEVVGALTKLKSYIDYGTFQPIQIASIIAINEASDYPKYVRDIYQGRRNALCDGLNSIGWTVTKPRGTMFVWARIPEAYREMGSLNFCKMLVENAEVAASPGVGFGPGGEGYVRFALIENEQRIAQGVRNIKRALVL